MTGVASVIDGDTIEVHGQRIRLPIGKLAEVGERWSMSHLYLDSC